MLFFCFSSKDRHSIVESILFHLTNYGLPVWYDRHKMLLGDERDNKNFDEGVKACNYSIIILSANTIASECANECKLRSNGMPVPLLRNGYSIFNGTKYR